MKKKWYILNNEKFSISSILVIETENEELTNTLYRILLPEVKTTKSKSTKVSIKRKDKNLYLYVEAKTTAGLRAILNSYLRWINSSLEVLKLNKNL